ncbi:CSLREA domain-containing protein [Candidatus Daviesbacteria bacterium]|nr:CSLREA domain-containing protein [Candidatus Daviesbacteria bacterium]
MVFKLVIFLFSLFLYLTLSQEILAATITVNTTNDELNINGSCSLREAIQAANTDAAVDSCTAGSGTDTINTPAGTYTLGIVGPGENANATGDLDILGNLTINGAGATTTIIDGGAIDRVFEIHSGTTVQINKVTVQNGNRSGVLNRGILTLTNSTITNNSIATFGGGGIFNTTTGTLTVADSTISNNNATSPDLSHGGGGIYSDTGGGVTISRTTINGNTTTGRGGGILGQDPTINITNSTISGNTALNGGGIFNRSGTVNLTNTTVASNIATDNGGGVWNFSGTMNIKNTILAANSATTASDDCAGAITSLGYNIASDASCALGGTGDLNSTNPMIGPLASNGGPTMTHALLPTSPAIDLVPLSSCTVATDQRGVARPQGAGCDSGSYEHPPTLPAQCSGNIGNYNIIQGTNGNDNLNGSSGRDLIFGYGGDDKLTGGANDDCLIGGPGKDKMFGGSGSDTLVGGDDNDRLDGDSGHDKLFGGNGNDDLRGGSGSDTIDGEAGVDDAIGGTGTDSCTAETETSCEL